jgi:phosphoribosylanthranilate isomerase
VTTPAEPLPAVKICGLTRRADAVAAVGAGASYLGVILMPGGRRSLTVAQAAQVVGGLAARKVGVFVNQDAESILAASAQVELDVIQLHGDESPAFVDALRARAGRAIWKAVRPRDAAEFLDAVSRYSASVDALVLDGWSETAYGGTGAAFPWEAVAAVRAVLPASVALVAAGGLGEANVARAVALLRPAVVDVSSGVEAAPGRKDHTKIRAFVRAARAAA